MTATNPMFPPPIPAPHGDAVSPSPAPVNPNAPHDDEAPGAGETVPQYAREAMERLKFRRRYRSKPFIYGHTMW